MVPKNVYTINPDTFQLETYHKIDGAFYRASMGAYKKQRQVNHTTTKRCDLELLKYDDVNMTDMKDVVEFIPAGDTKKNLIDRDWRELKTEHGQLILNTKSAPQFEVNNIQTKIADATDVIKMLITHATTTEKSLKHLYPGLLVPSNPTNATVNAYVVLRLYLSDGKDNKKS